MGSPRNLGCVTTVRRGPYLNFQIWERWDSVGGLAHAWNSLWLSFFPFFVLFRFFTSSTLHRSPRLIDFHDLYINMHVFAHGSALWGSRWWILIFTPFSSPKFEILHYDLRQLQTAITRASLKIQARCLYQRWGFRGRAALSHILVDFVNGTNQMSIFHCYCHNNLRTALQ